MLFEACDINNPVSAVLKYFGDFWMEIQNASSTPSKSNQLRNVNTVRWESGNVTAQQLDIDNRKSEVKAKVVNVDTKMPIQAEAKRDGVTTHKITISINFKSKILMLSTCYESTEVDGRATCALGDSLVHQQWHSPRRWIWKETLT